MARSLKIIEFAQGEICSYGCGQVAIFRFANSKSCCSDNYGLCPEVRAKNSAGTKKAYSDGKRDCSHLDGKRGWAKGLTKETCDAIRIVSDHNRKLAQTRERLTEKEKKASYKYLCSWDSVVIRENMEKIEGYALLKELGMYNKHTNPDGVVRDHRLSISDGYKNNIPPDIMNHPANCRFLPHKSNAKKTSRSELTFHELTELISKW